MTSWIIIKDNVVIDAVVADLKIYVENVFSGSTVMEDNGIIGIGWEKTNGIWKSPYPTDGNTYSWNSTTNSWNLDMPDETFIVE
jgi:hypothetical protein